MSAETLWATVSPILREQVETIINNDPSVLLERDGGPVYEDADVILARLYGADEQVDFDWRIPRVEPVLLAAIPVSPVMAVEPVEYSPLRTAEYRLQSNYAKMRLDDRFAPADVVVGAGFMFDVLFVRYRRRFGGAVRR